MRAYATTVEEASAWARDTSGPFDFQVFTDGHFFRTGQADQIIKIMQRHFQAERARAIA